MATPAVNRSIEDRPNSSSSIGTNTNNNNETPSHRITLWIVRHGERIDDVEPTWIRNNQVRCYDPPLTDIGLDQASKAGKRLRSLILANDLANTTRIQLFSSPFLRCVQTAENILRELNISSSQLETDNNSANRSTDHHPKQIKLKIEPGLSEWLKATWFPHGFPTFLPPSEILKQQSLHDPEYEPFFTRLANQFPETLNQLVEKYRSTSIGLADRIYNQISTSTGEDHHLILVTHGYGVQFITEELTNDDGLITETPYCCITKMIRSAPPSDSIWKAEFVADATHWKVN